MNEYKYLIETQSKIINVLEAENDKLRELVRDMWREIMAWPCYRYTKMFGSLCDRVRELKIIE